MTTQLPTLIPESASAIVTVGGNDAPAAGTTETVTVTTISDFPVLFLDEAFDAIDLKDRGVTDGYEIVRVLTSGNGTNINWEIVRGVNGITHPHSADWTLVPAATTTALNELYYGLTRKVALVDVGGTAVTSSPPSGPATIDGSTVNSGNRILLVAQTNQADNGIWIANTGGTWTRPQDWLTGAVIPDGTLIPVEQYNDGDPGTYYFGSIWQCSGDITVGTAALFQLVIATEVLNIVAVDGAPPQVLIPALIRTAIVTPFLSNAYTLKLSDVGSVQLANDASAATITVPTGLPGGFHTDIIQLGAGKIKIATSGTTVHWAGGSFTSGTTGTHAQYSKITLDWVATDTYVLSGDAA